MKATTFWALAAAAVFAAGAPVSAQTTSAPSPAAPVTLNGCQFSPRTLLPNWTQGRIGISFAAVGSAVSRVTFRVYWGNGEISDLTDNGTFSPGVTISHELVFERNGPNSGALFQTVAVGVLSATSGGKAEWNALDDRSRVACTVLFGGI